jgi:spermidine synthase
MCPRTSRPRSFIASAPRATSELYYSDLRTIQKVFPQVVLFETAGRGNVIACAVTYREPAVTDPSRWPAPATVQRLPFAGRLDLEEIRREYTPVMENLPRSARVLTDDFAPVEFLDTLKINNTGRE